MHATTSWIGIPIFLVSLIVVLSPIAYALYCTDRKARRTQSVPRAPKRDNPESSRLRCPECDSTEFYDGPEAGLGVNIKCAGCGTIFLYTHGLFPLKRLGVSKLPHISHWTREGRETEEFPTLEAAIEAADAENVNLLRTGQPAAELTFVYDEDGTLAKDPRYA